MPHVICEPCIGVKDRSCQEVCPVECIHDAGEQLYIHPDECIDCGACVPACPVNAIYPEEDVPEQWRIYIEKNRTWAQTLPNVHVLEGGMTAPPGLVVEVRQEVPLLPKVAFALISLASLLGALFTGLHLGLAPWTPARLSEKARRLLGWV